MKFFKFLKWQWNEFDTPEKFITVFIGWIFPNVIATIIFGGLPFLICIAGITLMLVGYFIQITWKIIATRWEQYNNYVDFEHQRTIAALEGKAVRDNPYTRRRWR